MRRQSGYRLSRQSGGQNEPSATATQNNDSNAIKPVDEKDPYFKAIQDNKETETRAFLDKGTEVNKYNQFGKSGLYVAAINGHIAIMKVLVERGAEVNYDGLNFDNLGSFRATPLHGAAFGGHKAAILYLIEESRSKVNVKDGTGHTPLHLAAGGGHLDAVITLVDKGALLDTTNEIEGKNEFDATGASKIIKGSKAIGITALHIAIENKRTEVALWLIRKGALFNTKDPQGNSPLHTAIKNGLEEVAVELILRGATMNSKNLAGESPYFCASVNELTSVLAAFIRNLDEEDKKAKEADPETRLISRFIRLGLDTIDNLLHHAAIKGNVGQIKRFASLEADLDKVGVGVPENPSLRGRTPLFLAARHGRIEVLRCLHELEADHTITDNSDISPAEIAEKKGHHECAELIRGWPKPAPKVQKKAEDSVVTADRLIDETSVDLESTSATVVTNIADTIDSQGAVAAITTTETTSLPTEEDDLVEAILRQFRPENSSAPADNQDRGVIILSEHDQLINQFKSVFAQHAMTEDKDLSEFLTALDKTTTLEQIGQLSTASGKNLLHMMAMYDPEASLLATVKKLPTEQISNLLHQNTNNNETPLHTAGFYHHVALCEFFATAINNPRVLYELGTRVTLKERSNFFQTMCHAGYDLNKTRDQSLLRKLLHQGGVFIEQFILREMPSGQFHIEHLPQRYSMLLELMYDMYLERPATTPRAMATTASFPRMFANKTQQEHPINGTTSVAPLRNQLLCRVFRTQWPEELLQQMATVIGSALVNPAHSPGDTSEEKIMQFIKSNCAKSPKKSLLCNHIVLMLALFYQVKERPNGSAVKQKLSLVQERRKHLEDIYIGQFQQSKEMLLRVSELYDYLQKTGDKEGELFLQRIFDSQSLLKAGLVEWLPTKPFCIRAVESFFTDALRTKLLEVKEQHCGPE